MPIEVLINALTHLDAVTPFMVPVGKFIGGAIFGEHSFGTALTDGIAELTKDRIGDLRKARDAQRKIEDLALSVVEGLAAFAEHERFDTSALKQVANDVAAAISVLDLGMQVAKAGRDPRRLASVIARTLPATADASDPVTGLTITAFAEGLCRIAGELPSYEPGRDQVLFTNLDNLQQHLEATQRDVSATREHTESLRRDWQAEVREKRTARDENEQQYRNALRDLASKVKLLGLEGDKHEAGRILPIETAYVPLRLRARATVGGAGGGQEEAISLPWPAVLDLLPDLGNRLLVEGIGGSGKTTLLQWTAVHTLDHESSRGRASAAGPEHVLSPIMTRSEGGHLLQRLGVVAPFETEMRWSSPTGPSPDIAWQDRVPLFVRLRHHADGRLPPPAELPRLIAETAQGTSEAWIREIIADKRALFLIDGIDEVPEEGRATLADGIAAYLRDFQGCALIATSRPAAVQDAQWANLFGSCRLQVERMARPEIGEFVRYWYKAYGEVRGQTLDTQAVARLLGQIEAREGLIGLMDTPLLAASICFLNKDRTDQLPTSAPELYRQLCRLLVQQLDEDRLKRAGYDALVPALRNLDPEQKLHLLAELAHLMVSNRAATLDKDQAVSRLEQALQAIGQQHGRDASQVLHALQERSGLLRGSSPDTVEFAHNNLRSWLAARAFSEREEHVLPVERAFDLKDDDLPVLTAAQTRSTKFRGRLIDACLAYAGAHEGEARSASIMALRCGQALSIDATQRTKLEALRREVLPPRSSDEAAFLSELGETIIRFLAAAPDREAAVDAACVRCLRLIDGNQAKEMLATYLDHEDGGVLDELAQAVSPFDIRAVRDYVMGRWQPEGLTDYFRPIRHVRHSDLAQASMEIRTSQTLRLSYAGLAQIDFVCALTSLQSLDISNTQVSDLEPLRGLSALHTLSIYGTQVTNLEPLRELTALLNLSISGTGVANLEPLRALSALQTFFAGYNFFVDLEPLCALTTMQWLDVRNSQITDLTPLSALTELHTLYLSNTYITDLKPLRGLTALQVLNIDKTHVTDLEPLCGLTALQVLSMEGTQITDLEPLRALTRLEWLNIIETSVDNLEPLLALTALKRLYVPKHLFDAANALRLRGVEVSTRKYEMSSRTARRLNAP